jgi:hypothetical protein
MHMSEYSFPERNSQNRNAQRKSNRANYPGRTLTPMDEIRRRRLALIWTAFALVMAYITLADGFTLDVGDLLGLVAVALGIGLAYLYYVNPGGMLDFGNTE